jgi:hypothetical protein
MQQAAQAIGNKGAANAATHNRDLNLHCRSPFVAFWVSG